MPIWIGGRTKRSLRRAVTLADGWCPYYVSIDTAAEWLQSFELPAGFEVVMPADKPLDPVGEPEVTREILKPWPQEGPRFCPPGSSITHWLITSSRFMRSPN